MNPIQTTGGNDEPSIVFMQKSQRTSQRGTQNSDTYKCNRTTQTTKKMGNTDHTKKHWGELRRSRRLLIRHPPCYSYIQSSMIKVLAVIEERKHLRKK